MAACEVRYSAIIVPDLGEGRGEGRGREGRGREGRGKRKDVWVGGKEGGRRGWRIRGRWEEGREGGRYNEEIGLCMHSHQDIMYNSIYLHSHICCHANLVVIVGSVKDGE